jgi:hypothetical protein
MTSSVEPISLDDADTRTRELFDRITVPRQRELVVLREGRHFHKWRMPRWHDDQFRTWDEFGREPAAGRDDLPYPGQSGASLRYRCRTQRPVGSGPAFPPCHVAAHLIHGTTTHSRLEFGGSAVITAAVRSSAFVLERQRDPRSIGDDLAVLHLHVELADLGYAQVTQ